MPSAPPSIRFALWQWIVLILPIATILSFLLVAAGWQIHAWGINWVWGLITLGIVGWQWLLVRWTRPALQQMETVVADVQQELEATIAATPAPSSPGAPADTVGRVEAIVQQTLTAASGDRPLWEDWTTFWQRCQQLIVAIAQVYHPEVKYPLLSIYVPQAYGLMRGTVDDLDQWMQKLSPVLNQVTVGQAYQAYEVYRRLEPSARKLWQAWSWGQWLLNPAAAVARQVSQRSSDRATQQLLANLGQLLREAALRNLARQAVLLYSGDLSVSPSLGTAAPPPVLKAKTQTLREVLQQATPVSRLEQQPVNLLLVGRTGAGKSSLINTLFQSEQAAVDILPSTDQIRSYRWQAETGETLLLWDTPGYEQVNRADWRQQVLDYATTADVILLLTPALDPALQMDADFLQALHHQFQTAAGEDPETATDLDRPPTAPPVIGLVTQVDRLRPLREWEPPYDWQWGTRPKEVAIREATEYRLQALGDQCDLILPLVPGDADRPDWNADTLALALIERLSPAKQLRLARFLRNLDARALAAARLIDRYSFQMTTTQGIAAFLKSPILQFISTLSTGSPTLAFVLAEQIPVEQLPIVIGKLQLAYDLYTLLNPDDAAFNPPLTFDLRLLWPVLLDYQAPPDRDAWALGHALVEYWTQGLTPDQLRERVTAYRQQEMQGTPAG